MITLEDDQLIFRFPEVHPQAICRVSLERTLRIPDDGQDHYLPPSLGSFPMRHAADFRERVEEPVAKRGGVILPMHRSEAAWLDFHGRRDDEAFPFALKVAAGKINAITGGPWTTALSADPQDYIVTPTQRWLDGFAIAPGVIRQFVAERLGDGYSVEEQLTQRADFGGLQLLAYPMKRDWYERLLMQRRKRAELETLIETWGRRFQEKHAAANEAAALARAGLALCEHLAELRHQAELPDPRDVSGRLEALYDQLVSQLWHPSEFSSLAEHVTFAQESTRPGGRFSLMGMAAGGRMRQEIYADEYGIDAWDQSVSSRCFVSLLNGSAWRAVTGEQPPTKAPSAQDYRAAGLPWFDYYRPEKASLKGSKILAGVKNRAALGIETAASTAPPAAPVQLGSAPRPSSVVAEPDE